jgi:hypothetical protein
LFSFLFSNSALYVGAVLIFTEPALECLAFTTSSELEGSGLRLAVRSGLLDKAVGVLFGLSQNTVTEIGVPHIYWKHLLHLTERR